MAAGANGGRTSRRPRSSARRRAARPQGRGGSGRGRCLPRRGRARRREASDPAACAGRSTALSSVDFPKPAGAETRVSARPRPWSPLKRSIRRGRGTACGRAGGMNSFVARTGVGMARVYYTSPHSELYEGLSVPGAGRGVTQQRIAAAGCTETHLDSITNIRRRSPFLTLSQHSARAHSSGALA